jgi:cold shock protein
MDMAVGRVIRFDDIKGYGFITPSDGGEDVFFHANDLSDRSMRVSTGTRVEFRVMEGDRGFKAYDVRVADDQSAQGTPAPAGSGATAGNGNHPLVAQPQSRLAADEELFEIFTEREFMRQITDLLLTTAPQLAGASVLDLRSQLLQFARKNGWVE